jgi:GTPase SAR1 family protein
MDKTIRLWEIATGTSTRILEGHTASVRCVAMASDQQLMASKGMDNTIRLWRSDTWDQVAMISEPSSQYWPPGVAFHPSLPLLASVGSDPDAPEEERDTLIHIWELDLAVLLGTTPQARSTPDAVYHTTAKIVLVGDSGVGKTGLGWRLAHGEFKEHASTHGQQFWVLNELGTRRADGTECEAILWDLAGQPDYRLTHALFLDDADLALVLFDPTDSRDPLHGVEFWLKQLKAGQTSRTFRQQTQSEDKQAAYPTMLIGARADRGEARLTQEELDAFCRQRGIRGGYLATSAKEEIGLEELLRRMKEGIPWDRKTTTVTTVAFKRTKDYALKLKENRRRKNVIVSPQDLRKRLEKTNKTWKFTDAEMMTAVGHLAKLRLYAGAADLEGRRAPPARAGTA